RSAANAARRSCSLRVSRKSVTTRTVVAPIISAIRSTTSGGTSRSPKERLRTSRHVTWSPSRRVRSTSSGCTPASTAKPRGSGFRRDNHVFPNPEDPTSPAEVLINATPRTRSRNSSGRCSANAMIVMPPIEWPTSTTSPVGATARSTASRSRPSCSIVLPLLVDCPARPWLRWSYSTRRVGDAGEVPLLEVPAPGIPREASHADPRDLGFRPTRRQHFPHHQRNPVSGRHRGLAVDGEPPQRLLLGGGAPGHRPGAVGERAHHRTGGRGPDHAAHPSGRLPDGPPAGSRESTTVRLTRGRYMPVTIS